MKNRYVQRLTRIGQNGDYMLRSRTRSGSEEHEPMTIEYCSNYEEFLPNDSPPTEVTIDQLAAEAFTEEFQLIQSGDFVLTAPSCNNPTNSLNRSQHRGGGLEEQRELPPPEAIKEFGRTQTTSFDVDFPSIEKTYTTFINVAEDQIYPLEWKDFLEVAREEDDRLMPLSKESALPQRKTSKPKKVSNVGSKSSPPEPSAENGTQNAPSNASINSDINDSESLNSDTRKFRLFPNIRDVASRRTKRMEAARSRRRLLDGKNDAKKVKNDRAKGGKNSTDLPPADEKNHMRVPEHHPKHDHSVSKIETRPVTVASNTEQQPVHTKADLKTQSPNSSNTDIVQEASIAEIKESPTHGDIALHELAEKIMGKNVNKPDIVDFTKRKRNGKKKKKNVPVIHNSTSFPTEFSSEAMYDVTKSTKEVLLSQDDEIVTYDQDKSANDVSDTATVVPGVETIFNDHVDSENGPLITLEEREVPDVTPEKKLTIDSILPAFALSKSFDDLYHSFVVKSIKKEIEAPQVMANGSAPDPEVPVPHSEPKWFGFGKQLWQHTTPSRVVGNAESHRTVEEEKQSSIAQEGNIAQEEEKQDIDARDALPATSFATSLSDILRSDFSSISQAAHEMPHDASIVVALDSPGDEVAPPINIPAADDHENVSVVSCHAENEEEEVESVASSTMTPIYSSFLVQAGSWLSRFGAKANGLVTCAQNPFGESKAVKRGRKSRKVIAVPSLDRIQETFPAETRDEIDEEMEICVSKDAISRVDSRTSSVSINSMASSKSFDSEHSDSSSSDEEENASRISSYDSGENVEVGWCG